MNRYPVVGETPLIRRELLHGSPPKIAIIARAIALHDTEIDSFAPPVGDYGIHHLLS
jgi:hypothetical protein